VISEELAHCINPPNLEDQVIFGQGFLPLALDKLISNCWAAVLEPDQWRNREEWHLVSGRW
jgi:hypothetical protein